MGDYDLAPEAERDLFEIALNGLENSGRRGPKNVVMG